MSRTRTILTILVLAFTSATFVQSQAPLPTRDSQAVSTVQNAIVALGGSAAISQITDATAQGTFESGSGTGTFVWQTSGSEFRYSTRANTDSRILVSGHGSPADVRNGVAVPTGTHLLRSTLAYQIPGLVLLQEFNNSNYSMIYVGPENLNGTSVSHIQTVDNSDDIGSEVTPQDWYFDAGTFLPVRVAHRIPDSADATSYVTTTRDFGSYAVIAGVQVPSSILINGSSRSVTITSIQFNTGLSPNTFDAPVGGGQ